VIILSKPKYLDTRSVLEKGGSLQVTIPSEYVQKHGIKVKDNILFYEFGEGLLLLPFKSGDAEKLAQEKIKDSTT